MLKIRNNQLRCFNGNKHLSNYLIEIYTIDSPFEAQVIRWCSECGAVVTDTDVDGRTFPGDMQFPNSVCML